MTSSTTPLPWENPDWMPRVTAWIYEQLAAQGMATDNPVEILHQRVWSTFLQVETPKGKVYFKAPAPAFRFEAPLTQALTAWYPDRTVPLLAVNLEEGWTLSADAGVTIRSQDTEAQLRDMEALLAPYAEFQQEMAVREAKLLSFGVPDRRLATLPRLYDALLEDHDNLRVGLESGLTAEEYAQAQAFKPTVVEWCAQLASYGIAETLTHEELTPSNILVGNGRAIYTDWSDCSVAHPFFTMLVTIRATAHWLKLEETGPEMTRLREAYMEPWTTIAPRKELDAAYALAVRLGKLNRSLSWQMGTGSLSAEHKADYLDYVPGWLQEFLDDNA